MKWTNSKLMAAMADGVRVVVNGHTGRIIGIRPDSGRQDIHNWIITLQRTDPDPDDMTGQIFLTTQTDICLKTER